jgi:hypothetical protein
VIGCQLSAALFIALTLCLLGGQFIIKTAALDRTFIISIGDLDPIVPARRLIRVQLRVIDLVIEDVA